MAARTQQTPPRDSIPCDQSYNEDGGILVHVLSNTYNGRVSIKRHRTSGKLYVEKVVSAPSRDGKVYEPQESLIPLKVLYEHPNIVTTFSGKLTSQAKHEWTLELEYCDGGDMRDLIKHLQKHKLQPPMLLLIHFQIALIDALLYMHSNVIFEDGEYQRQDRHFEPIMHRDIKPRNVFLLARGSEFGMKRVVIGDFGSAREERTSRSISGTHSYWPPENLRAEILVDQGKECPPQTARADVWTMGATMHHLITLVDPAGRSTPTSHMSDGSWQGTELESLVLWCLTDDPKERPSAFDLLPFVKLLRQWREQLFREAGPVPKAIWPEPLIFDELRPGGVVAVTALRNPLVEWNGASSELPPRSQGNSESARCNQDSGTANKSGSSGSGN